MYYVMFDQQLLDLQQELLNHPKLMRILQDQPNKDIYIGLQEIATHLGIILDGNYTKDDLLKLCEIMTERLYKSRTIDVLSLEGQLIVVPSLQSVKLAS